MANRAVRGRPAARTGRHTNWQRLALAANIVVVIGCFAAAAALVIGKRAVESRDAIDNVQVVTTTVGPAVGPAGPDATFPVADPTALNFLVAGSGQNACIDPNSPWANAADEARGDVALSDTIMVIRIDPASHRAAVLSFPRDLWVERPDRGKGRINSTYHPGDYAPLAQTIYDNFGIQVDHYLQVDFCAFKTIIEAVGGVTVPFTQHVRSIKMNLDIPAGCHAFKGDEAVAYVRARDLEFEESPGTWKGDPYPDLGRIARQQDFLRRVLQTALDKGMFSPAVMSAALDSMQHYVVTDNELSLDVMFELAGVLQSVKPSSIPTYQVEASRLKLPTADVLKPELDSPRMEGILGIFRGQVPLEASDATTATPGTSASGTTPGTPVAGTTVAPAAVVTEPDQPAQGIVPPKDVTC